VHAGPARRAAVRVGAAAFNPPGGCSAPPGAPASQICRTLVNFRFSQVINSTGNGPSGRCWVFHGTRAHPAWSMDTSDCGDTVTARENTRGGPHEARIAPFGLDSRWCGIAPKWSLMAPCTGDFGAVRTQCFAMGSVLKVYAVAMTARTRMRLCIRSARRAWSNLTAERPAFACESTSNVDPAARVADGLRYGQGWVREAP